MISRIDFGWIMLIIDTRFACVPVGPGNADQFHQLARGAARTGARPSRDHLRRGFPKVEKAQVKKPPDKGGLY